MKGADRRPGPYPYYGASGVVDHVEAYLFEGTYLLIAEDGENLRTRKTPVAFLANGRFWVNNHAHIVRGNDHADTRYLMYYLSQADIGGYLTGSTMPKLTQGNLNRIPIAAPPVREQSRIAAVLGLLDEKIDLNRQMNQTLEDMAQAIFKSWFVDFDGSTEFVDSTLGRIPSGWPVGSLNDVVRHVRDSVKPSMLPPETPYVGLEHIPRMCAALDAWGQSMDVESGKSRFVRGDVLFGKLRPYFHKVVVAPLEGVCSTDILVLRPRQEYWRGFAFGHLFSTALVGHASAMADGTKMPRTCWEDLTRYELALPPEAIARKFNDLVQPMLDRIIANVFESRTLASLRDTLLPKLISGEVRVPEAEQTAMEAL